MAWRLSVCRYRSDCLSNLDRYIKVAALLPYKSVRDVAARVYYLRTSTNPSSTSTSSSSSPICGLMDMGMPGSLAAVPDPSLSSSHGGVLGGGGGLSDNTLKKVRLREPGGLKVGEKQQQQQHQVGDPEED